MLESLPTPAEPEAKPKRFYGKTRLYIRGIQRDPLVQAFVEKVQEAMPEISEDRFYPVLYTWCELEVLSLRAFAELKPGVINAQGDSRRLLDDWRRLRATQLAFSRELGLTPASLASIRALVHEKPTLDLEAVHAEFKDDTES